MSVAFTDDPTGAFPFVHDVGVRADGNREILKILAVKRKEKVSGRTIIGHLKSS